MKKLWLILIAAAALAALFSSNDPYDPYYDGDCDVPIYMKRADLEQSVKYVEAQPLKRPGKIYCIGSYIYINELYKGVHVINNSNPQNPFKEGFIKIPGCVDIAVKEQILYADNSVDLVAFDLTAREETHRIKNVLPEPPPPKGYYCNAAPRRDSSMILVEWRPRSEIE